MIAVEVSSVSKSYSLNDSPAARLRQVIKPGRTSPENTFWALRDVSFTVKKGESFGIIGANGSGKSTLLQIIAGILQPSTGSVQINGRVSALLELGSGFNPEFTGRDNVYLNASILGLSRAEIDAQFGHIERFADIGAFIDQPIKTYSTGMVLRLAFAVAAHVDPEILIVDEALAVGDIVFRQRCMRRIHDLRAKGTTILFVSHDTGDIKALCERCLWLRNGAAVHVGPADEVVAKYLTAMFQGSSSVDGQQTETTMEPQQAPEIVLGVEGHHRYGDGRAAIIGASLVALPGGEPIAVLEHRQPVVLRISLRVHSKLPAPIVGFLVRNQRGETIFGSNSAREEFPLPAMVPGDVHTVDFHWVAPQLAAGPYFVSTAVSHGTLDDFQVCDYVEDAIKITVPETAESVQGYIRLHCASVVVSNDHELV